MKCGKFSDSMEHFVTFVEYGKEIDFCWTDIFEDYTETQKAIPQSESNVFYTME